MQEVNSPSLWKDALPKLSNEINKYDKGHVVILGGNIKDGSTGAAKLAAYAALRSGAGLVSIVSDRETAPIYASSLMSVMVKIAETQDDFTKIIADKNVKSVLIGPGSGVNMRTKNAVLSTLLLKKSLILDADGLNVFSHNPQELFQHIQKEIILTPHDGEFKRLFELTNDRVSSCLKATKFSKSNVLLKGHETIIASAKGKVIINKNAPATLATAGSGDVLAGIIAGLVAQALDGFTAMCIASYIHADAAKICGLGLISEDLIDAIPQAFLSVKKYELL